SPIPAIPAATPAGEHTTPAAPMSLEQRLRRLAIKGQQVQINRTMRERSDRALQQLGTEIPRSDLEKGELGVFRLASVKDAHGIAVLNSKLSGATAAPTSQK